MTAYGVAVMLACKPVARGVDRAQARITEAAQELTVEPESVMSRAVYQHFRARREAVATVRADLRKWAVAESAYGTVLPDYGEAGMGEDKAGAPERARPAPALRFHTSTITPAEIAQAT